MNTMLDAMLEPYESSTAEQRKQALRQVAQEVILCGLSRAGFFGLAAFDGRTALRIFYGLDRFSEDMDFSLRQPDESFNLGPYLVSAERECEAWGLHFQVEEKRKSSRSAIKSALLKNNTRECLITLFSDDGVANAIAPSELLRINLELDTDPAPHATFDRQYRLLPSPYAVGLYDYVFYRSRNTPINVAHLGAKLQQTGQVERGQELGLDDAAWFLCNRFESIDYGQAKADVLPFIRDPHSLDVWSADFFCSITAGLSEAVANVG